MQIKFSNLYNVDTHTPHTHTNTTHQHTHTHQQQTHTHPNTRKHSTHKHTHTNTHTKTQTRTQRLTHTQHAHTHTLCFEVLQFFFDTIISFCTLSFRRRRVLRTSLFLMSKANKECLQVLFYVLCAIRASLIFLKSLKHFASFGQIIFYIRAV